MRKNDTGKAKRSAKPVVDFTGFGLKRSNTNKSIDKTLKSARVNNNPDSNQSDSHSSFLERPDTHVKRVNSNRGSITSGKAEKLKVNNT